MKILLAIDDSKYSAAATRAIVERIKPDHAEVRVLTVADLINYFTTEKSAEAYVPHIEEIRVERLRHASQLVKNAANELQAAGFKASVAVSEGDPKGRILEMAEEWGADLIVMGSHGRRGFDRALLGSVAESVAHYAKCSVEIIRISSGT